MRGNKSKRQRRRFSIEDQGNWEELQRTPEIKTYSQGVRRLFFRGTLGRLVSLAVAAYMVGLVFYVFGGPGIEPGTTAEGRKVFILTVIAGVLAILFVVVPITVMIYRSWWMRVSRRRPQRGDG